MYGGVALNYAVGGFNPYAVRESARQGGRIVWLPTIGARHFIRNSSGAGFLAQAIPPGVSGLTALDDDGDLRQEVLDVLDQVIEQDLTLASGHLEAVETRAVFAEAVRRGAQRLLVTHPHVSFVHMPAEDQLALADVGAYIEITDHETIEQRLDVIRRIGAARCVLSTDGGTVESPTPVERLGSFARGAIRGRHPRGRHPPDDRCQSGPSAQARPREGLIGGPGRMANARLLTSMQRPPVGRDAEFECWWDRRQPDLQTMPGLLTARQWRMVAGWNGTGTIDSAKAAVERAEPTDYLATYDMVDVDARQPPEPGLPMLVANDRRVYRPIALPGFAHGDDSQICGPLLMTVSWDIDDEFRPEFEQWYLEEHLQMLIDVPGTLRIRRFESEDWAPDRYLALHDLESMAVFDHPLSALAARTPWRARAVVKPPPFQDSALYVTEPIRFVLGLTQSVPLISTFDQNRWSCRVSA